jgi:hypothetical protein
MRELLQHVAGGVCSHQGGEDAREARTIVHPVGTEPSFALRQLNALTLARRISLYGLLASLALTLVPVGDRVFAQETAEPVPVTPKPGPVTPGPLAPPQERLLSPIPTQFDWMNREVRPNLLLETLLGLQEGPPRLFMSVTLAGEYTDNFSQTDAGGDEFRLSTIIGTVYRLESRRSFVSLANTLSANYDVRSEAGDFGFMNLSLNAGHELPRLSLTLSENFVRNDDTFFGAISDIRVGRSTALRNRVSPQVRFAFSRLTSMTLAYINTLVVNEGEVGNDSLANGVSVGLQHQFSRVFSGGISYTFSGENVDAAPDQQSHSAAADLGYVLTRRLSLSLHAFGSVLNRSEGGTDAWNAGGSIGLRSQLTSYLAVFIAAGPTVAFTEDDGQRAFANWQINLEGALPIFRTRRTTLTLATNGGVDDTSTDVTDVGLVLRQSVSLTLNQAISRALQLSLFGSYTRTDFLDNAGTNESDPGRDDNFWRTGVTASYALTRVLSLSVNYLYQRRDSNRSELNFDENRVTIVLSGNFSLL